MLFKNFRIIETQSFIFLPVPLYRVITYRSVLCDPFDETDFFECLDAGDEHRGAGLADRSADHEEGGARAEPGPEGSGPGSD